MSQIIVQRRDLILPNRHRQRGFIINPFRYATGGGGPDPYWANVTTLLNFPGADGSTTFTDEKGRTWTASGTAQIDTSLGYNAGQFDGSGYIETAYSSDLSIGTGDYTVEALIRPAVLPSGSALFSEYFSGGSDTMAVALGFCDGSAGSVSGGKLFFGFYTGVAWVAIGDPDNIPTGSLVHVAATKAGTTYRIFVGGTLKNTVINVTTTPPAGSGVFRVGRRWDASGTPNFNGHIAAFRVTKGVCRYTANFTPPTAPFPNS